MLKKVPQQEHRIPKKSLRLKDSSRIAVLGGGPAGSFFSYFLLGFAKKFGLSFEIDIYESRDFSCSGPQGCNMCGGIISESLIQILASDGISLPPSVVQRGIDAYMLHMDVGSVLLETPRHEKRIGAVFRGEGPRGIQALTVKGFDNFMQELVIEKGAKIISERVKEISLVDRGVLIKTDERPAQIYDLTSVALGINTSTLKLFDDLDLKYRPPEMTETFICEYYLGEEAISHHLGNNMHTFLLDIPRLEFAALIPKGEYVTVCMLGQKIDKELVWEFLNAPKVKRCFPQGWMWNRQDCQCMPRMNIGAAAHHYADRLVFIGDCGTNRLYKDGIGGAYRTARSAATTAVLDGIAAKDFGKRFRKVCRSIEKDNQIGKYLFVFARLIHKSTVLRRGILLMVRAEQHRAKRFRLMSTVLWDIFTGSAPYREILWRMINPLFISRLVGNIIKEIRYLKNNHV